MEIDRPVLGERPKKVRVEKAILDGEVCDI
jgi:hypothetical protein